MQKSCCNVTLPCEQDWQTEPLVLLRIVTACVAIRPASAEWTTNSGKSFSRLQIPLKLGCALIIHESHSPGECNLGSLIGICSTINSETIGWITEWCIYFDHLQRIGTLKSILNRKEEDARLFQSHLKLLESLHSKKWIFDNTYLFPVWLLLCLSVFKILCCVYFVPFISHLVGLLTTTVDMHFDLNLTSRRHNLVTSCKSGHWTLRK